MSQNIFMCLETHILTHLHYTTENNAQIQSQTGNLLLFGHPPQDIVECPAEKHIQYNDILFVSLIP